MMCPCGGTTKEKKVINEYKVTSTYEECGACGRVGRIKEILPAKQKDVRWEKRSKD